MAILREMKKINEVCPKTLKGLKKVGENIESAGLTILTIFKSNHKSGLLAPKSPLVDLRVKLSEAIAFLPDNSGRE